MLIHGNIAINKHWPNQSFVCYYYQIDKFEIYCILSKLNFLLTSIGTMLVCGMS